MTDRFFTSDTHFGHKNMINWQRTQFSSVEEMDEQVIANWNSRIRKRDLVYHLGDFAFYNPEPYLKRLNGFIHLIEGNHDRKLNLSKKYVQSLSQLKTIKVDGIHITLCHYSMNRWKYSQENSWHLFGHSHGKIEGIGKSFDVGVDCHNLFPINFDEVREIMKTKPDNDPEEEMDGE